MQAVLDGEELGPLVFRPMVAVVEEEMRVEPEVLPKPPRPRQILHSPLQEGDTLPRAGNTFSRCPFHRAGFSPTRQPWVLA